VGCTQCRTSSPRGATDPRAFFLRKKRPLAGKGFEFSGERGIKRLKGRVKPFAEGVASAIGRQTRVEGKKATGPQGAGGDRCKKASKKNCKGGVIGLQLEEEGTGRDALRQSVPKYKEPLHTGRLWPGISRNPKSKCSSLESPSSVEGGKIKLPWMLFCCGTSGEKEKGRTRLHRPQSALTIP